MRYVILVLALCLTHPVVAKDIRYCEGQPARNEDGTIKRSSKAVRDFKKDHPCPVTGLVDGACPGWAVDHTIPLACGGCDSTINMAWMPLQIKSGPGTLPKDRWERKVYCRPMQLVPMPEKPPPVSEAQCRDATCEAGHN